MSHDENQFGWNFDNTYLQLPDVFYEHINPTPATAPRLVLFNADLAQSLGLNSAALAARGQDYFSGRALFARSHPLAQAYAGHQFGHPNMLGDGRAHLFGEHVTPNGQRFDIQLKGSGPTRFSRRGDGLAALGPMLREYVISEAMFALGIPTTRSLAVVATGQHVLRETPLPGGVLTRVAQSHIRVGTFEYAANIEQGEHLRALADYTLQRHYPELASQSEPYLALLNAVIERQASLIVKWMHVGFIHGVMNTDNMTLSGETIDYGPCAFMNRYSPATVFSSIDRNGRYAYGQQPAIAQWNLTRLAESILPLLNPDQDTAIAKAEQALNLFPRLFQQQWLQGMREKLGLEKETQGDAALFKDLLGLMETHQADYTNTFRELGNNALPDISLYKDENFLAWHKRWLAQKPDFDLMCSRNPAVIPRNHLVEGALAAAVQNDDYTEFKQLITVLQTPFTIPAEAAKYTSPPADNGEGYKTFCGT